MSGIAEDLSQIRTLVSCIRNTQNPAAIPVWLRQIDRLARKHMPDALHARACEMELHERNAKLEAERKKR